MVSIGPGSLTQGQAAAALADAATPPTTTAENAIMYGVSPTGAAVYPWRNNGELTLLASAARTADIQSADQTNLNWRGGVFTVNVTAGTSAVVFTVQGKDPASGGYYTILASASVTGAGLSTLTVYPGVTATTNVSASTVLPRTFRIDANETGGASFTYSVGFVGIV